MITARDILHSPSASSPPSPTDRRCRRESWGCHSVTRGQRKHIAGDCQVNVTSFYISTTTTNIYHVTSITYPQVSISWVSWVMRLSWDPAHWVTHWSIEPPPFILVTALQCSQLSPGHVNCHSPLQTRPKMSQRVCSGDGALIPHSRWCHHALECQDSKHIWPLLIHFVISKNSQVCVFHGCHHMIKEQCPNCQIDVDWECESLRIF